MLVGIIHDKKGQYKTKRITIPEIYLEILAVILKDLFTSL
jgi:hypothetical protein